MEVMLQLLIMKCTVSNKKSWNSIIHLWNEYSSPGHVHVVNNILCFQHYCTEFDKVNRCNDMHTSYMFGVWLEAVAVAMIEDWFMAFFSSSQHAACCVFVCSKKIKLLLRISGPLWRKTSVYKYWRFTQANMTSSQVYKLSEKTRNWAWFVPIMLHLK